MNIFKYLIVSICILMPWNATALNHGSMASQLLNHRVSKNIIDSLLVKGLLEIAQGKTKQAIGTINELINTAPNFKLAYLIRGDLLAAQGRPLLKFGDSSLSDDKINNGDHNLEGLREEARVRLDYYLSDKKYSQLPNLLVKLGAEQENLIVVDTASSRLFLYKKVDGVLTYIADYYVTIGKNGAGKQIQGDKRTPLGVYFASKKLTQPLEDMYGSAAYALNYPNELDLHQNKNGNGIWLHGTPTNTYSRPPRASDGCVVLSNPDLNALAPYLISGKTPVIISNNIQWLEKDKSNFQAAQQKMLEHELEQWRIDWASQQTEQYLSHYSQKFFYSDGGFQQWANHKRGVQASRPKVTLSIRDISMFSYPNFDQPIVVVDFEQNFKSVNLQNKMLKRQYWLHENNQWKIIYEGAA